MRSTLSAPTELIGLFGQTMPFGTIFYADILGFAGKARVGEPAMDALPPIFAESATKNLVGAGVVAAVRLESSGVRGPRLLLDEPSTALLKTSELAYALRCADVSAVLWPIIDTADGIDLANLRPVFRGACRVILEGLRTAEAGHFITYTELIARCFQRLGRPD